MADQLRGRFARVAALMDQAEADVLAYLAFPQDHRGKLHSTNGLERLNKEVKRRANGVGIFPNEASLRRLIGARLTEQNDEWLLQNRYLALESWSDLSTSLAEAAPPSAARGRLTEEPYTGVYEITPVDRTLPSLQWKIHRICSTS